LLGAKGIIIKMVADLPEQLHLFYVAQDLIGI